MSAQDRIDAAREQLRLAQLELEKAQADLDRQRKEEEGLVYKPTNGEWWWTSESGCGSSPTTTPSKNQGREFKTKEGAESALERVRWYAHLLNLAAQLNPSGKVCRGYGVTARADGQWFWGDTKLEINDGNWIETFNLFETSDAAYRATKILDTSKGALAGIEYPGLKK